MPKPNLEPSHKIISNPFVLSSKSNPETLDQKPTIEQQRRHLKRNTCFGLRTNVAIKKVSDTRTSHTYYNINRLRRKTILRGIDNQRL